MRFVITVSALLETLITISSILLSLYFYRFGYYMILFPYLSYEFVDRIIFFLSNKSIEGDIREKDQHCRLTSFITNVASLHQY